MIIHSSRVTARGALAGAMPFRRSLLPATLLLVAACASTTRQAPVSQAFPTTPPAPTELRPAEYPPFQQATLSNGVRLVVVESDAHPVVSMSMAFAAGDSWAPDGREGLPSLLASLLTAGAGDRSSEEISELIESAGGYITASAGSDFLTVSAGGLSSTAPLIFELLGDAVARATIPESELSLERQQVLNSLRLAEGQPGSLAQRALMPALYGTHPYARQRTARSIEAITRDDLVSYRDASLRPQGALLVVAGNISLADARRLAEQAFEGWTGAPAPRAVRPPVPVRQSPEMILVHRPGSVQSTILVGNTTFGPRDERYHAAVVANHVLGGATQSRLFQILREERGWTYGASSALVRRADTGYLVAQTDVRTEVTDSALVELLAQMRRISGEPVGAGELEVAKASITGQFPLTVETAQQVAGAVLNQQLYGLPDDYLATYRTKIAAVQAAELAAAARAVARPDAGVIVVVGDGARIYQGIAGLAPMTIVSPQGDTLDAATFVAGEGAQATATLDPARLFPTRDSVAVMMQGNQIGAMIRVVTRTAEGWTISDSSSVMGSAQNTTATFGPDLGLRSFVQSGSVQGQQVSVELTVSNGRLTGSARSPATGFQESDIDFAAPGGAVDENSFASLLAALPLQEDGSYSLAVLNLASGEVEHRRVEVSGTEQVSVPAGSFEAFRVESSGNSPFTAWISTAAPHRLVKVMPVGIPLELVLVSTTP